MFKIKSLNRDSISDDDAPVIRKEAQEENALMKYNNALKLQRTDNSEEARALLQSLLENDIPEIENRGGLPKTMSTLKYSCFLNIGTIALSLGFKQDALNSFVHASELDKTDVTLWFKIGSLALELNHFKQSAYSLSKGLECNKNHWPSLDKIITLLYAMRDTVSCLYYISHGLQLDPDYVRGLMLRKRIYEKNPGTQDYYLLYNPDCTYDPPLTTTFDEAEGKELEKESDKITQRIRAIELELEPKPLPVLPLSKPLEDYTWVSLGQSIIHMHRYIAEEKLSFLCRINLSERTTTDEPVETSEIQDVTKVEKNECEPHNNEEDKISVQNEKDKNQDSEICELESDIASEIPEIVSDDTETEAEKDDQRKQGKESEQTLSTNPNSKSNSQEDSETPEDEREQKKLENDENADVKEKDKVLIAKTENCEEKMKSKPAKRRRNSLSFLQPWAWHSKRKSSKKVGKNDKDDTIEGVFRKIIPNSLLPNGLKCDRYKQAASLQQEDSLNTMDLYRLFIQEQEQISDSPAPSFLNKIETHLYFGTQEEFDDVENFWKYNWERCDIISMLEKFVTTLGTMWKIQWPQQLKAIYIDAYEMYREHFDHPQVFNDAEEFKILRTDTVITLLYSELIFDKVQECIGKNLDLKTIKQLSCNSLGVMDFVCTRKTDWGSEYLNICLRLHWLKANIYIAENKNDLAIRSLNSIIYFLTSVTEEDDYYLQLPNCVYNSFIALKIVEKSLKSLEMLQKLSLVETLFQNNCYEDVIKILQETFTLKSLPKYKTKTDKPVQIVMLLHALWLTNRYECFLWTEICLNESLPMYLKTHAQPDSFEHKRWSLVVVKCMVLMEACIKEESIIILDYMKENQTRLIENLTSIICHQINSKSAQNNSKMPLETVKPWILLHYVLQREEHRIQAKRNVKHCENSDDSGDEQQTPPVVKSDDSEEDDEQEVPPSVSLLFSAHEFLGRRGWCLENEGELLLFVVDVVLHRLNAPIFEGIRDKIDIHLEQAFFCLYQHPSKKNKVSRHLADHNVDPLSLSWDRAQQLYEFYQPRALPEFDSYRYSSISNEMEQLLLRILALVPSHLDPQSLVPQVKEFVNGQVEHIPEPIDFPYKVSPIYYLLGDYYLKQHDPAKGLKYFLLDLCINPTRLDTWADMALGVASELETKLNHCETFKNESDFLDKARSAQICFKQALQLSNGHSMLWIEYGNFVYMSHSFCSRLLKGDTDMLSMEKFEALESQKEAMLDTAVECFTAANIAWHAAEPGEHDERWLHHYMLGKIAEKKKQDPSVYLDHFSQAAKFLFENKATYPLKINYSNPQNLSVEALEIYYRIHASILKYLELHEDRPISRSVGKVFQKYLKECDNGLFSKSLSKYDEPSETSLKRPLADLDERAVKRRRFCDDVIEDVTYVLNEVLKKVEANLKEFNERKTSKDNNVVMVLDSDEEPFSSIKSNPASKSDASTPLMDSEPKIRVKNAQEIMDELMKKCMANQPEYKSETETDIENDVEKDPPKHTQKLPENICSPSRRGSTTSTAATTTTTSTSDSSDSSSSSDSSDSSSSDSESSESESSKQSNTSRSKENSNMTAEEIKKLTDQCLLSLEQCISRFSQNYKALYRLTHFYLHNKSYRNLTKCRQLLLSEYQCADSSVVTGLFSDRRNSNFFNGVWRIPTSEIDRPGSFAAHMSRCVLLLMQVLRDCDDHKILLDLCLLLRRTPDPDKIYIRDVERQQLSDQALSICIQSLRGLIKKAINGNATKTETESHFSSLDLDANTKLILDVHRAYQKVQKHFAHKESIFANLLVDVYKHFMKNNLPEGANYLDLAVKYCQQRKAVNKPVNPPVLSATVIKPPVAPIQTSSLPVQNSPTLVQPLRKSSKSFPSRPRGRPPNVNKNLTGLKSGRGSKDSYFSSTNPYAWQNLLYSTAMGGNIDPKLALNYMMSKYQEELLRHYAQSSMLSNPFSMNKLIGSNLTTPVVKDKVPVPSSSKATKPEKKKSSDVNIRYSKESDKSYYGNSAKDMSLFKDRPGISITPVQQATSSATIPKPLNPLMPSSPGKTLQQKLAERQKQNPAAQKSQQQSAHSLDLYNQFAGFSTSKNISFAKPTIPLPSPSHTSKYIPTSTKTPDSYSKQLSKQIPSSLTITKAHQSSSLSNTEIDSGVSISQIGPKMSSFRKPHVPKMKPPIRKLGNDITVTSTYNHMNESKSDSHLNVPLSLSITKTDANKTEPPKKSNNVEIITIE